MSSSSSYPLTITSNRSNVIEQIKMWSEEFEQNKSYFYPYVSKLSCK